VVSATVSLGHEEDAGGRASKTEIPQIADGICCSAEDFSSVPFPESRIATNSRLKNGDLLIGCRGHIADRPGRVPTLEIGDAACPTRGLICGRF
jgi:hypothetical protein